VTDEGAREAGDEEIALAREELRATEALLAAGIPRVALTRAYFAAFHVVRALLFDLGIEPRSHRAAASLFARHYIRTGRLPREDSRILSRLQKYREDADYGGALVADDDMARDEVQRAADFVARAIALIRPS
jgi:uncharacterized protein (UPF0332 family)